MPPPPPSPEYKHFCRVCNKGFTCGSALGGHMRAHGASDDALAVDDDEEEEEEEEEELPAARSEDQWDAAAATTHAYALRANPNRLVRSCQVCKNCGKEFTSWELFLEHGRCSSDDDDEAGRAADADGGSSSPISDGEEDPAVAAAAWSKGKRSRRVKLMAADDVASRRCASGEEEEDLANCLVMLSSSSNADHAAATAVVPGTSASHHHPEPSAPASRESDRRGPQLLQPISFLAPAPEPVMALPSAAATTTTIQYAAAPAPRGLFECKACKKVFTSHQALGGHRASHKKVKGCFAARFDTNVSEAPIMRHAATTSADPSSDNGKAGATLEANTHYSTPDAKPSIYSRTDGGDTNAGTTSETSPSLSMALVAPTVHDPPPVAAAFNVGASASSSPAAPGNKKNAKMHECSVCHRLFTSGQALGGHKRCHWLTTSSTADPTSLTAVPPLTEDLVGAVRHQLMLRPMAADAAAEPALDLTIAAKQPPLRLEAGSGSFHLDVSSPTLHLQSSPAVVGPGGNASHRNRTSTTSGHDGNNDAAAAAAEDEADSTVVKKARLTDLKDVVRMDGEDTAEPGCRSASGRPRRPAEATTRAAGDDIYYYYY